MIWSNVNEKLGLRNGIFQWKMCPVIPKKEDKTESFQLWNYKKRKSFPRRKIFTLTNSNKAKTGCVVLGFF